jgi:glycosidase
MDPHASDYDKKLMSDGWFDHHMPDLDQTNPHLATYLIQNNIWWVEYAGLDGYRIDTYAYPDQAFMADWAEDLRGEYPHFHMFAETWVHGAAVQAHFTEGNNLTEGYDSQMPAVTDFQLYYAINEALNREQGWTDGAARIYFTLAKDFLYQNPMGNVVFLDNHDLSRFYSMIEENDDKFRSGVAFLLTTRGIPMIYYGTEILMKNFSDPDGKVREDFPGGWKGDKEDKFKEAGRNDKEQAAFDYVKRLANYRKGSEALRRGQLKQFVPQNGLYVYFRYTENQTVMVMMNTHGKPVDVDLTPYGEMFEGFRQAKDIMDGSTQPLNAPMKLSGHQTRIWELD